MESDRDAFDRVSQQAAASTRLFELAVYAHQYIPQGKPLTRVEVRPYARSIDIPCEKRNKFFKGVLVSVAIRPRLIARTVDIQFPAELISTNDDECDGRIRRGDREPTLIEVLFHPAILPAQRTSAIGWCRSPVERPDWSLADSLLYETKS